MHEPTSARRRTAQVVRDTCGYAALLGALLAGVAACGPVGSTAAPAGTPSATAAAWPAALGEPQQGDPVWGVYLAVGHASSDPALDRAVQQAASVGYQAVRGDLACDGGALAALKLDEHDYWAGASLYFATWAQAQAFIASYTGAVAPPTGFAKVSVGCLD